MASRRQFLREVGRGMLVAGVGSALSMDLRLAKAEDLEAAQVLDFGAMEPLVCLMQETPTASLQSALIDQLQQGRSLQDLIAAGALANARSFGGQDYNGFHTFMALGPALYMSQQLPSAQQALPVLKVLYRNNQRIQECGGRAKEVLHVVPHASPGPSPNGIELRAATREADFGQAESLFANMASGPADEAFNHLQFAVQDEVDVHRTVLAWRAWSMLDIAGSQHAHTLLRQSVRYCVDAEQSLQKNHRNPSGIRELLPALLEDTGLMGCEPGKRLGSETEVLDLSRCVFAGTREQAAQAVAAALADGMHIESVGEALSLAANQLLLFDPGRSAAQASADKPEGSVHGASVGVHACDSANAWRNIARVSNARNQFASMIVGAYHTAGQQGQVNTQELPYAAEARQLKISSADLLASLSEAVRAKDQLRTSAIAFHCTQVLQDLGGVFNCLLEFAVSQEGALHAEKFYRTVTEEYEQTRPSLAWRQLVALARVSASEYGFPAAGQAEARQLLLERA